MTKREAYREGYSQGYAAAENCDWPGDESRNHAGCDCDAAAETTSGRMCSECLTAEAFESESNARQFSPWEFIAAEINAARDPDGQWEAYDRGVAAGIKCGVQERLAAETVTQ